jgi:hypothetical protein
MAVTDQEEAVSQQPRPPLSTGDGIAIVGLVMFILLWVGGWILGFELTSEEMSGWNAFIWLTIIAGPPFWAACRITDIIRKD